MFVGGGKCWAACSAKLILVKENTRMLTYSSLHRYVSFLFLYDSFWKVFPERRANNFADERRPPITVNMKSVAAAHECWRRRPTVQRTIPKAVPTRDTSCADKSRRHSRPCRPDGLTTNSLHQSLLCGFRRDILASTRQWVKTATNTIFIRQRSGCIVFVSVWLLFIERWILFNVQSEG